MLSPLEREIYGPRRDSSRPRAAGPIAVPHPEMSRFLPLVFASLFGAVAASALAQDFAVETKVFLVDGGAERLVATGMTLSHAGRIYDYYEPTAAAGEVLIYERGDGRFEILNPARGVKTTATATEIARHIEATRAEFARESERLRGDDDPARVRLASHFEFDFDGARTTFAEGGAFAVAADAARYRVASAAARDDVEAAVAATYADYADAVARLGFVLHPSPLSPELRTRVNGVLRDRVALPTEVVRETDFGGPPGGRQTLRAEHVFTTSLNEVHRSVIYQWEALLDSATLEAVPLRRYVKISHDAEERG